MTRSPGGRHLDPRVLPSPPWLWMLMAAYASQVPERVGWWRAYIRDLTASGTYPPQVVASQGFQVLRTMAAVQLLPTLFLLAGAVTVLLPRIRARVTRWRHGLTELAELRAPGLADPAHPLRQIERIVRMESPGTQIMVSNAGKAPPVRVYAGGWRDRRMAVSWGFVALWRRNPASAGALLAHEAGHLRGGEHLVTGLGSPFERMVGAWLPSFAGLAVLPVLLLYGNARPTAGLLAAQLVLVLLSLPRTLVPPVAVLWAAELAADRFAVVRSGVDSTLNGLTQVRLPWQRRLLGHLYHPPFRLRAWFVRRACRDTTVLLLALVGPVVLLLDTVLALVSGTAALIAMGDRPLTAAATGLDLAHRHLNAGFWLVTLLVLATWPVLAPLWVRLWDRRHPPGPSVGGSWVRLHLVVALLPALVLVVTLIPHGGAVERDPVLRPASVGGTAPGAAKAAASAMFTWPCQG